MNKAIFLAAMLAATGAAQDALAQAAPNPRECIMNVGPVQMMFSAFQERRAHDTFCRHIPDLGSTVIILDARDSELRNMALEVRILRDLGQTEWNDNLDANTEYVVPPIRNLAKAGTVSFEYNFKTDGKYIALVRAVNEDGTKEYIGEYPFSVGETVARYLALGAILIALCFVYVGIWPPARSKTAGKPAVSGR